MKRKVKKLRYRKLHRLLAAALRDLRWVEGQENKYNVDMACWHRPNKANKKCTVCLAGALLARTLNTPANINVVPGKYDDRTADQLYVLEYLRRGRVVEACTFFDRVSRLYRQPSVLRVAETLNRELPHYGTPEFWPAIITLVRDLKENNL